MIRNQLYLGFRKIWDSEYSGFEGMGKTNEECAESWKKIFLIYYRTMGAPLPGSSNPNLNLALEMFKTSLLLSITSKTIKENLELIITKLHYDIILGITSMGIFSTTPPPIKLDLKILFEGNIIKADDLIKQLSIKIDTWVHLTKSINNQTGIIVIWS